MEGGDILSKKTDNISFEPMLLLLLVSMHSFNKLSHQRGGSFANKAIRIKRGNLLYLTVTELQIRHFIWCVNFLSFQQI